MRFLKIISLILIAALALSLAACSKTPSLSGSELEGADPTVSTDFDPNGTSSSEPEIEYFINPLTGLRTLTEDQLLYVPTAVIVNNISNAQRIQSGVGKADVVFETEVEGGITRLLAVYKAPTDDISHIGSIRSARVVLAELAASMNAALLYHGMDEVYCRPRINALGIDRLEISEKAYGKRINNGESWEHRLYTTGASAAQARDKITDKLSSAEQPWLSFSETKTAANQPAKKIAVKFRGSKTTDFFYNEATGNYSRGKNGTILKDYFTDEEEIFTNIFVLKTSTSLYSDGYHREVKLSGGEGYYITKGGVESITWSKSGDHSYITFKDSSGQTLSVTPGNSYICIVDKNAGKVTFE